MDCSTTKRRPTNKTPYTPRYTGIPNGRRKIDALACGAQKGLLGEAVQFDRREAQRAKPQRAKDESARRAGSRGSAQRARTEKCTYP